MRFFNDKKGGVFSLTLAITVIIVLIYGYIALSDKTSVDKQLGESPSELVLKVQEGEKALIFVDLASKLAVQQSLYELQSKGGLTTKSACGEYFGFNLWNTESGTTCYVNRQTVEKSLRDLFESNLVARLASYPNADFLANTPAAASFARSIAPGAPGVSGGGATYCTGTEDLQKDFDYPHSSSGFYPKGGSRLFIPAEANCPGSYDLVIFLHGCQAANPTKHNHFGDNKNDIIPVVKNLLKKKAIVPIILAAPSQTKGNGWRGNPNGVCGSTLWGYTFDFKTFVDDVKAQLPSGINIKSISFMGHSGAGCTVVSGIHRALQQFPDAKAVAQLDTCPAGSLGSSLKEKAGANTNILVVYGAMGYRKDAAGKLKASQENSALGISKDVSCLPTDVPGGTMRDCQSSSDGKYFSSWMKVANHGIAVPSGTEEFLLRFFPSTGATTHTTGQGGCIPGQTVGVMGDSITHEGSSGYGYVTLIAKSCKMTFKPYGVRGQNTGLMLKRFKSQILDNNYDQVIIFGGTNDNIQNKPASKTIANLESMYSQAKAKNMRVIAVTVPPYKGNSAWTSKKNKRLMELNNWIKTQAKVDVVVDIYSVLKDPSDPEKANPQYVYPSDHLHPNPAGHKLMANTFLLQAFQKPGVTQTKT